MERTLRMHAQTLARFDEQATAHRAVTKSTNDDIAAYKGYVQDTFSRIDNFVKLKIGELENAINIGINDSLNVFSDKIKMMDASISSLTSFVHHTGQQAYTIAKSKVPARRTSVEPILGREEILEIKN